MSKDTLCCDYCGEENRYVPIIQKPTRFGYKGRIYTMLQTNNDNRSLDNICIDCLGEELENLKEL